MIAAFFKLNLRSEKNAVLAPPYKRRTVSFSSSTKEGYDRSAAHDL